jgi:acyl-CoA thioesterase FadM
MNSIFSHRQEVRFSDCDPMGHANNAVLHVSRAGATRTLARCGFRHPRRRPRRNLARAEIGFRRPARYGEMLEVRIGLAGIGRTSFTYDYEIVDEAGNLVATAKSDGDA